ncbi:MAG TPA: single-stranded-DNA-specific exonuclease RecJ [candidate division Zixibacteria bacterium]|nr:single-stranded-DNA-specific exonuclease RecJ [candidate division Zixibacteria bacterium]
MNLTKYIQPVWQVAPEPDFHLVDEMSREIDLPDNILKILINRGLDTAEKVNHFINPSMSDLKDPFLLPDMEKGVERIVEALRENEKMMVYGDYDVDGITAAGLMFLVLNKLGAQISYYLPNRLVEGYGISEDGLAEAVKQGVTLIISVDTGVTAVDEVERARELGIDIIVTDHHEPGPNLPKAVALINPKLHDEDHGSHELSGVGVAFKVAQALYRRLNQPESELEEHLDLVALGTSADIVPLVDENRILTKFGIKQIIRTTKPGLKSLTFVSGLLGKEISTGQVVYVLAPRINAIGRLGNAEKAIRLLTTRDEAVASKIAKFLEEENRRRKSIDEKTLTEALEMIETEVDLKNDRAIVLASKGWHQGVIGIVASRLVEKFYLPTILIAIDGDEGKGSARSIPNFHIYNALNFCSDDLLRFGGHKYAAGLTIKPSKIEIFSRKFKQVALEELTDEDLTPKLKIDAEIDLDDIDEKFIDTIDMFAPFGPANMRPIFLTRNLEAVGTPHVVGKNHLKMKVKKGEKVFDVIGFGFGEHAHQLALRSVAVDLVYVAEMNYFGDQSKIQLRIKDLRY